jgi:predicted transcriptional regulator YdeE
MDFVQLEHFAVIGTEVRTSNAREMTPEGLIGRAWERFSKEHVGAKPIAVYSEYASDEHGEYNYLLGVKVPAIGEIPAGMTVRHVPTGRYAVFTSERGPAAKVVYETWKRIWAEPRTARYARSYRADFEKYLEDGRVEIYIGVKD